MKKDVEIFLTSECYLKLEEELNYLKLTKREEIVQAIKEARSHGDLSENSEYDAARDEQAQLEVRITELEFKLEHAQIVDNKSNDVVSVGSTVVINYVEDDETEEYYIVGSLEADPFENKISNESPIGSAILGKCVGDVIAVTSPNGSYDIKIESIA